MMNNELPTPPAQETLKPCPFCGAKQAGALAARASPAQAEGESNVAPQVSTAHVISGDSQESLRQGEAASAAQEGEEK